MDTHETLPKDSKGRFVSPSVDDREVIIEKVRDWIHTLPSQRPPLYKFLEEQHIPRTSYYRYRREVRARERGVGERKARSRAIAETAILVASGLNDTQIAEATGRSEASIKHIKDESEIAQLCKDISVKMADLLPQCYATLARGIENDPRLAKEHLDDFGLTPRTSANIDKAKNDKGSNITIVIPPLPAREPLPQPKLERLDAITVESK